MVDIQSAAAEIRRGIKKEEEDRKKLQGKNIMSASATQGGHNKVRVAAAELPQLMSQNTNVWRGDRAVNGRLGTALKLTEKKLNFWKSRGHVSLQCFIAMATPMH